MNIYRTKNLEIVWKRWRTMSCHQDNIKKFLLVSLFLSSLLSSTKSRSIKRISRVDVRMVKNQRRNYWESEMNCRCRNLSDYMKIAEEVKEFFHNEGIHSTTIQPEFTEVSYFSSKFLNLPWLTQSFPTKSSLTCC